MRVTSANNFVNTSSTGASTEKNKARGGKDVNPPSNPKTHTSRLTATAEHSPAAPRTSRFVSTRSATTETHLLASTSSKLTALQRPNMTLPEQIQKKSNSLVEVAANTAGHWLTSAAGGSALAQATSLVASGSTAHTPPTFTASGGGVQTERTNLFPLSNVPNPNWVRSGQQANTQPTPPLHHSPNESEQPKRVNHIKLDAEKKDPKWASPSQQKTVTATIPPNEGIGLALNAEGKEPGRVQVLGNDLHLGVFGPTGYSPLSKKDGKVNSVMDPGGRIFDVVRSETSDHKQTHTLKLDEIHSTNPILPLNAKKSMIYPVQGGTSASTVHPEKPESHSSDHKKEAHSDSPIVERGMKAGQSATTAVGLKVAGEALIESGVELPNPGAKMAVSAVGAGMYGLGHLMQTLHPVEVAIETGHEGTGETLAHTSPNKSVRHGILSGASAHGITELVQTVSAGAAARVLAGTEGALIGERLGGGLGFVVGATAGTIGGPVVAAQLHDMPDAVQGAVTVAGAHAVAHEAHKGGHLLTGFAKNWEKAHIPTPINKFISKSALKVGQGLEFIGSNPVKDFLGALTAGAHGFYSTEKNKVGATAGAVGAYVLASEVGKRIGRKLGNHKLPLINTPFNGAKVGELVGGAVATDYGAKFGAEFQQKLENKMGLDWF